MKKELNIIAELQGVGGGEQAVILICKELIEIGWQVNLIKWGTVNERHKKDLKGIDLKDFTAFEMKDKMTKNIPLFFYGNDGVYSFSEKSDIFREIVDNSSCLILGINFVAGGLQKSEWIKDTQKLAGVIFLNQDKKKQWEDTSIFDKKIPLIVLHPIISIDNIINETGQIFKRKSQEMIILRHSTGDSRKFVNKDNISSIGRGLPWQKFIPKKTDIEMYGDISKISKHIKIMFMVAPQNLIIEYKNNEQFQFYKWDEISVNSFLKKGHIFLYRTSNLWDDQGPRSVTEAIASGLPILTEPRYGLKDRVENGYNGFHCTQTEDFILKCKTLYENEDLRFELARNSRIMAKTLFKKGRWAEAIQNIINNYE